MPVIPTYPGVYLEEVPSGVRTITGVATSITAFIGRTLRGPVSEPTIVNNFGEFESRFGGLWMDSPLSYALRDFYLNGGTQAIVVRLFSDPNIKAAEKDAKAAVEAVVKVVEDSTSTNPAEIATAARNKANEFTAQPAKAAADAIAKTVEAAAQAAGATPEKVKEAATEKDNSEGAIAAGISAISIPSPNARLKIPLAGAGADAAKAVAKAAQDETGDANAVATAARTSADTFTEEPAKSIADQVAKAAEAAAQVSGATPEAVKAAAQKAAEAEANFILEAANPGRWGDRVEVAVNYDDIDSEVAERYGLDKDDLFNLVVLEVDRLGKPARIERIPNVAVVEGSRRLDRVLAESSNLVRVPIDDQGNPQLPMARPAETPGTIKVAPTDQGADSSSLDPINYTVSRKDKTGIYALEKADLFNLVCIPPDRRDGDTDKTVYAEALKYCVERRAMLIVDPPMAWGANKETAAATAKAKLGDLGLSGTDARNAALYFPRVIQPDPLREGQLDTFVPCGIIAGIMARTDLQRGVWKAPAGIDAAISGIDGLQVNLTNEENGLLNPIGINCLRNFPPVFGRVVWGARTLRGADQLADEYKYVPIRRLLLFLQESLYRGTQWVVFEPNDEPLWSQIRLNIGVFMNDLFRQGAFQGQTPAEAYFVKCDKETTTQSDRNRGIVNIIVGFAPLKPAEFVIIKFQQIAGQLAT